jgi:small subunit ribosomal protein S20
LANIKSAMKRARKSVVRYERNRRVKSALRTTVRKFNEAAAKPDGTAAEQLKAAFSSLDRAAAKGVIHKNTAARKKARLAKKLAVAAQA